MELPSQQSSDPDLETLLRVQAEVRKEIDDWSYEHVKQVLKHDIRQPIHEPSFGATHGFGAKKPPRTHRTILLNDGKDASRPPWLAPDAPRKVARLCYTVHSSRLILDIRYSLA